MVEYVAKKSDVTRDTMQDTNQIDLTCYETMIKEEEDKKITLDNLDNLLMKDHFYVNVYFILKGLNERTIDAEYHYLNNCNEVSFFLPYCRHINSYKVCSIEMYNQNSSKFTSDHILYSDFNFMYKSNLEKEVNLYEKEIICGECLCKSNLVDIRKVYLNSFDETNKLVPVIIEKKAERIKYLENYKKLSMQLLRTQENISQIILDYNFIYRQNLKYKKSFQDLLKHSELFITVNFELMLNFDFNFSILTRQWILNFDNSNGWIVYSNKLDYPTTFFKSFKSAKSDESSSALCNTLQYKVKDITSKDLFIVENIGISNFRDPQDLKSIKYEDNVVEILFFRHDKIERSEFKFPKKNYHLKSFITKLNPDNDTDFNLLSFCLQTNFDKKCVPDGESHESSKRFKIDETNDTEKNYLSSDQYENILYRHYVVWNNCMNYNRNYLNLNKFGSLVNSEDKTNIPMINNIFKSQNLRIINTNNLKHMKYEKLLNSDNLDSNLFVINVFEKKMCGNAHYSVSLSLMNQNAVLLSINKLSNNDYLFVFPTCMFVFNTTYRSFFEVNYDNYLFFLKVESTEFVNIGPSSLRKCSVFHNVNELLFAKKSELLVKVKIDKNIKYMYAQLYKKCYTHAADKYEIHIITNSLAVDYLNYDNNIAILKTANRKNPFVFVTYLKSQNYLKFLLEDGTSVKNIFLERGCKNISVHRVDTIYKILINNEDMGTTIFNVNFTCNGLKDSMEFLNSFEKKQIPFEFTSLFHIDT